MTGKDMKHAMHKFEAKVTLGFKHTFMLPTRANFKTDDEWLKACVNRIAYCWANNCDEMELIDYLDHCDTVEVELESIQKGVE